MKAPVCTFQLLWSHIPQSFAGLTKNSTMGKMTSFSSRVRQTYLFVAMLFVYDNNSSLAVIDKKYCRKETILLVCIT